LAAAWATETAEATKPLRVCADPNNLPFSNQQQEGFENKIAEVLAHGLGQTVSYTWWPQRRGFLRSTLNAGKCDVVMGLPVDIDMVLTTQPYYRSVYAFVYPEDTPYDLSSLDDPVLKKLKIGVHLIGDDYTNSPPAHALSKRGIVDNVVGYSVFGNYADPSPPGKIIEAVANNEIDTAIVWGPIGGYFAQQQTISLRVVPVASEDESPSLLFAYDIALGVRKNDEALKNRLNSLLTQHAEEIQQILADYGVPGIAPQPAKSHDPQQDMEASDTQSPQASNGQPTEARGKAGQEVTNGLVKLNPYTGNPAAISEGEELYKLLNCYSCHGLRGGGGMGPDLTDEEWKEGTGDDNRVMDQVMTGRNKMPGYDGVITEEEAWKVIAYVRTLYKGDPSTIEW
jgi:quinoprotein dehydrogenase-associated probable ABC transporter substrate-binding protein